MAHSHALTLSVWPQRVRVLELQRKDLPRAAYAICHALLAAPPKDESSDETSAAAPFFYLSEARLGAVTLVLEERCVSHLRDTPHSLAPKRFAVIEITGSLGAALHVAAVGVIHSVARPLAAAQLSIFYLSSYDTDFLLVAESDLSAALSVLARHFTVVDEAGSALASPQHTAPTTLPSSTGAAVTTVRRALALDSSPLHLVGLAPGALVAAAGAVLQLVLWPQLSRSFFALCVTAERVSLVCDDAALRALQDLGEHVALLSYSTTFVRVHVQAEEQLGFDEPGIVEALARPLAQAHVPIFQISTFGTEHTLISVKDVPRALGALRSDGYVVHGS